MHEEIIISGFGGQGVLFAGQLLAYAVLAEARHVTWIPSYGPEMRGGTAHCTVCISDEEIGSPLVRHPSAVILMNPPSFQRYMSLVKSGGLLLLDEGMISERSTRDDIHEVVIPAQAIAAELGFDQIANLVLLGALVAATSVVKFETLDKVLEEHLSLRHQDALVANRLALRRGAAFCLPLGLK
ncbi:2-oxoacid:acceptor oxidoreductase family protein [Candidatus Chlorohelix sp.]|uniref:2-oxoacid:acceptor oxidoreductase family protein n=1 Tax=Candidatus Chlorohelix sp. TaxID=3139201 RepID=UPI0030308078